MSIDDGWSKGGRHYDRLRARIGPDFGDCVLDAIDRRDAEIEALDDLAASLHDELERTRAERDMMVAIRDR
ncbi:MAG TPA: hypothetical protein VMW48_13435 [Vicinamibacterales bacterium]|nr:hypothetical protein [Vicinamibacterales bacterium]